MDGVNEAWVAGRPTSHRCWPSRSAFQGWLCLDNTSQYRCWRWKTTVGAYWSGNVHSVCPLQSAGARSGARGSTFLVVTSMHWSHSEVFLEGKIFKDLQHPRKLVCLPNCCWRRCVGDVAGMTWESGDGIDSNSRSCWHRFHGGGHCAERAWHLSFSWSAVLCCRSTPAHGDHISTYL